MYVIELLRILAQLPNPDEYVARTDRDVFEFHYDESEALFHSGHGTGGRASRIVFRAFPSERYGHQTRYDWKIIRFPDPVGPAEAQPPEYHYSPMQVRLSDLERLERLRLSEAERAANQQAIDGSARSSRRNRRGTVLTHHDTQVAAEALTYDGTVGHELGDELL